MNFYQDLLKSKEFKERFIELISGVPRKVRPVGFNVARRFMPDQYSAAPLDRAFDVGPIEFRRPNMGMYYLPNYCLGSLDGYYDAVSVILGDRRFLTKDDLTDTLLALHHERADFEDCGGVIMNPLMLVIRPSPLPSHNVLALQSKKDLTRMSSEELEPGFVPPELERVVEESFPGSSELAKHMIHGALGLTYLEAIAEGLRNSGQYHACALHWIHGDPGFERQLGKLVAFSDDFVIYLPGVRENIEEVKNWESGDKGPKPTK